MERAKGPSALPCLPVADSSIGGGIECRTEPEAPEAPAPAPPVVFQNIQPKHVVFPGSSEEEDVAMAPAESDPEMADLPPLEPLAFYYAAHPELQPEDWDAETGDCLFSGVLLLTLLSFTPFLPIFSIIPWIFTTFGVITPFLTPFFLPLLSPIFLPLLSPIFLTQVVVGLLPSRILFL